MVAIEFGGDFSLKANAAGEVRTDLLAGRLELWYPQGVTDKDKLGGGHFRGYAEEDRMRGGFLRGLPGGRRALSAKMELANAERKKWRRFRLGRSRDAARRVARRSRLEGEKTRTGIP